jgi:SAM-dependent methyltransferase
LARIYDDLDDDRTDLDAYERIVDELSATSVLDIGCGTGTFALRLAARGRDVTGVDPAAASLDVARAKAGAEQVTWLLSDPKTLPPLHVDVATMTGNVAQVFLSDEEWLATLQGVGRAVRPGGHLVFEVRDPTAEAWRAWTRDQSWRRIDIPGVGPVESWVDLIAADLPLVSFRWTYRFEETGESIVSDSTLRFRTTAEIEASLAATGHRLLDVRDAPDRPGLEHVFIAQRAPG